MNFCLCLSSRCISLSLYCSRSLTLSPSLFYSLSILLSTCSFAHSVSLISIFLPFHSKKEFDKLILLLPIIDCHTNYMVRNCITCCINSICFRTSEWKRAVDRGAGVCAYLVRPIWCMIFFAYWLFSAFKIKSIHIVCCIAVFLFISNFVCYK